MESTHSGHVVDTSLEDYPMCKQTTQDEPVEGVAPGNLNSEGSVVHPASDVFAKAFPHLVPGVLRQRLSPVQIQQRALGEIEAMARYVARYLDRSDRALIDEMGAEFAHRLFAGGVFKSFDASFGKMESYLRGMMWNVGRERLRERSRQRSLARLDSSRACEKEIDPSVTSEQDELVKYVRKWAMELPLAQRNAVAREFDALADLDTGGDIPNIYIARHRGRKRLREKAAKLEEDRGGG
jgi:DNA-directed RNA polymerase specialized sigma24 family protein